MFVKLKKYGLQVVG